MKTLSHCPKCKDPLLNTSIQRKNGVEVWKKSCINKIDHTFLSLTKEGNDDELAAMSVTLNFRSQVKVTWDLLSRRIYAHKGEGGAMKNEIIQIPWFEPDLNSY